MWKYGGWVEANKRNILAGTLRWQLYQNSQYSAPSKWPILKRDSQFSQYWVKFKFWSGTFLCLLVCVRNENRDPRSWRSGWMCQLPSTMTVTQISCDAPLLSEVFLLFLISLRNLVTDPGQCKAGLLFQEMIQNEMFSSPVTASPCSQTLHHQQNTETEIHANCLFSFS